MKICRQTENKSSPVRIIISILLVVSMLASLLGMLAVGNLNLLTMPQSLRTITLEALSAPPLSRLPGENPQEADSNSTEFSIQNLGFREEDAKTREISWDFSLEGLQDGLEKLVFDILLAVIQSQIDSGQAMDPQLLWRFYDRSPSKEFLGEKMVGIVQDLIYDTKKTTVTLDEVEMLIEENQSLLEEAFGVSFTPLHRYVCVKLVEHSGALEILEREGILGMLRWSAQADKVNGPARLEQLEQTTLQLEQLRQARSLGNLAICGAAFAVLLTVLCLVSWRRHGLWLAALGGVLLLGGLVFTIPLLAGLLRPTLLEQMSAAYLQSALNRSGMLAAVHLLLPLDAGVSAVGLLLLLIGAVSDNNRKSIH